MNFYTQGVQAALMKLGAVPFTGQEAQYFQEMLQARGLGAPIPKTMVAQPAMAYAPTQDLPKTQVEAPGVRHMTELPPSSKTIAGGVERGTMAGLRHGTKGAVPPPPPAAPPVHMRDVISVADTPLPGGGRQLAKGPAIPMDLPHTTGRQLGVPLHQAQSLERYLLPAMEEPGVGLARQMGKAEGAKALGLGAGTQVMEEGLLKRLLRMGQKVRI
jgi:hypothetical protein